MLYKAGKLRLCLERLRPVLSFVPHVWCVNNSYSFFLLLTLSLAKAFIRKGLVYFMMKDYRKALEVYDEGLKLDGENTELIEGAKKAIEGLRDIYFSS